MKNKNIFILSLFLLFSFQGISNYFPKPDTISYWTIHIDKELIADGSFFPKPIILKKGKIKVNKKLKIRYNGCGVCYHCKVDLIIKNDTNKVIKTIKNNLNYSFEIKTITLQLIAQKTKNSRLKFFYKEEGKEEAYMFDIAIK